MKILIICTYFPPDTCIAAVRPYMLAKYLSAAGHQVTVLRSGELYFLPDNTYSIDDAGFKVITYLGDSSPAVLFEKGIKTDKNADEKEHFAFLPNIVKQIGKYVLSPYIAYRRVRKAKIKMPSLIKTINQLDRDSFDVVFSTYGNLENIWGGSYAANKLKAKWILDFRDPVVWYDQPKEYAWNIYASHIQRTAVNKADACTAVSEGLADKLRRYQSKKPVYCVYNGFDEAIKDEEKAVFSDQLVICYTGTIYEMQIQGLKCLLEVIRQICQEKKIPNSRIKFVYAGNDSYIVNSLFAENGLKDILDDQGYVLREKARKIQMNSDLFLVLSWNTTHSTGVLSGKFYEGIRAGKKILAMVSGTIPNSELYMLNQKFQYGYCCEIMKKDYNALLKDYLIKMWEEKKKNGYIDYCPSEKLINHFRYDRIAKQIFIYIQ